MLAWYNNRRSAGKRWFSPSLLFRPAAGSYSFAKEAPVTFKCPHCKHPSRLSQPKAGRFKPKCPKCKQAFILVIDNAGKLHVQIPTPKADPQVTPSTSKPGSEEEAPAPNPVTPEPKQLDTPRQVDATAQFKGDSTQQLEAAKTLEMTRDSLSAQEPKDSSQENDFDEEKSDAAKNEQPAAGMQAADVSDVFTTVAFEDDSTSAPSSPTEPKADPNRTSALDETSEQRAPTTFSSDSKTSSDKVPKRLGGYKLDRQLGKGGMGTVYLATQVSLDRQVAIKILKPSLTQNPSFVSRFVREAYAAAQLVHHNVVQIYDIGSQGDVHYFSMELVKGDSLAGLLKRQRRLDCDTAAGYILQAARGLKFAHDQGMVHRDVKPANLMLDEHGIVKVADLGLVKIGDDAADENVAGQLGNASARREGDSQITQFGMSVGTPTYMAPEQWKKSSEVDQRADIYSLGCTFYVLVTGKLPFDGKTPKEVVTKVITEQAVPPELLVKDIPKKISLIVHQMLAKDPKDRYPDMGKLISDLEEYLGVSSTGAFSPSERHVEILEKCVGDFNNQPMAKLRKTIVKASLGLALLLFLGGLVFHPRFAMGVLGTVMTAGVSYFTVRGQFEKNTSVQPDS